MSAVATSAEDAGRGAAPPRFAGLISLGRSLAINVLAPALLYAALEPHFKAGSVMPLLAAMAIPAVELVLQRVRRGLTDGVAIVSLVQFSVALLINLTTHDRHAALVGHAWQPALQGLVYGVSVLMGRPIMRPLARQAMCGDDPQAQATFDAVAGHPYARRSFNRITLMWTAALSMQTAVQLAALTVLPAKDYVLLASVLGWGVNGALVWASIRYGQVVEDRMRGEGLLARAA